MGTNLVSYGHGYFHSFIDFYFLLPLLPLVPEYNLFGPLHVRFRKKLDLLVYWAGMLLFIDLFSFFSVKYFASYPLLMR